MSADAHLPQPWRHPAFHEMQIRIETLKEENRQLRELVAPRITFPAAWRLSPAEARILAALYCEHGCLPHERIQTAAGRGADVADYSTVSVLLCRLRRKLRPFGICITTHWGTGLELAPKARAIICVALGEAA